MNSKCNVELTKEELMILIEGLDLQSESRIFSEWGVNLDEFRKRLSDVFYKLNWSDLKGEKWYLNTMK